MVLTELAITQAPMHQHNEINILEELGTLFRATPLSGFPDYYQNPLLTLFFSAIFEHGIPAGPVCARQFSGNPDQRDSGYYSTSSNMKTLEKFNTIELSEFERNETFGGFGLIFVAFMIGVGLAYYEQRIKV